MKKNYKNKKKTSSALKSVIKLFVPQSNILKFLIFAVVFFGSAFGLALYTTDFSDTLASIQTSGTPAFPGADGFGKYSLGGRGGTTLFVTNTNPDGPGSLKAAVEAEGRRIVVFKTGGTITLTDNIEIKNPYITIAGQSAPGDGIQIEGAGIFIGTHDVIIRGLRVRVGDDPNGPNPTTRRGLSISGNVGRTDVYNVIVDSSSFQWGVDTNVSTWTDRVSNVTISYNLIAEGLNCSIHIDEGGTEPGCHSKGSMLGSEGSENITFHHNLFAHNADRNPRSVTNKGEIINNIVYNWKDGATNISSRGNSVEASIIGNMYIPGPNTRTAPPRNRGIRVSDTLDSNSKVFVKDNIGPNRESNSGDEWDAVFCEADCKTVNSAPFTLATDFIHHPLEAYSYVTQFAGARAPQLDTNDQRILDSVISKQGGIIDSQEEVGGAPNLARGSAPLDSDSDGIPNHWEDTYDVLDPNNPFDAQIITDSGYSNLEIYLNSLIPAPNYYPVVKPGEAPVIEPSPTPTVVPTPTATPIATPVPTTVPKVTTVTIPISTKTDDVEQKTDDGSMSLNSKDLQLVETWSKNQVVGLKFRAVSVPKNAKITAAYIEFTAKEKDSVPTSISIRAEKNAQPLDFSWNKWNLSDSNRERTSQKVDWNSIEAWDSKGKKYRTPDLSSLITEVTALPEWNASSDIVFIMKGSGQRTAHTFDNNRRLAPKLVISYEEK